jgi:hypothetical protein
MQVTVRQTLMLDRRGYREGSNWEVAFFRR